MEQLLLQITEMYGADLAKSILGKENKNGKVQYTLDEFKCGYTGMTTGTNQRNPMVQVCCNCYGQRILVHTEHRCFLISHFHNVQIPPINLCREQHITFHTSLSLIRQCFPRNEFYFAMASGQREKLCS